MLSQSVLLSEMLFLGQLDYASCRSGQVTYSTREEKEEGEGTYASFHGVGATAYPSCVLAVTLDTASSSSPRHPSPLLLFVTHDSFKSSVPLLDQLAVFADSLLLSHLPKPTIRAHNCSRPNLLRT